MSTNDYDVVLLTDSRYVNPTTPGEYVRNILNEDRIAREALENKGLKVARKDWADPDFDWNSTGAVLFRTAWDYFDRMDEFNLWLASTSLKTHFINTASLINWNIDKQYLGQLGRKKIRTIPTRFIPRSSGLTLEELYKMTGWQSAVIKPTIGGAGRHTYSITNENLHTISNKLKSVMEKEDFMLQPFQHSVPEQGEWSFVVFGNRYSHAVLKKAKEGDFRVQDDFGGTVHTHNATQQEIDFVLNVVAACPEEPAYARVDVILDNDGYLAVSELELIEPELWFRHKPEAANLLAEEVLKRIP